MGKTTLDLQMDLIDAVRPVWALLTPTVGAIIGDGHSFLSSNPFFWYSITGDVARAADEGAARARQIHNEHLGAVPNPIVDLAREANTTLRVAHAMTHGMYIQVPEAVEFESALDALDGLYYLVDDLFERIMAVDAAGLDREAMEKRKEVAHG